MQPSCRESRRLSIGYDRPSKRHPREGRVDVAQHKITGDRIMKTTARHFLFAAVSSLSLAACAAQPGIAPTAPIAARSEEHTSELQSLMRISYAVFCLKQKHMNSVILSYLSLST